MHITVIGGTGHIGTYLVPRLVKAGHTVTVISRGGRNPYHAHAAWKRVECISLDRTAAEAEGTFGQQIRDLAPDAVIDLLCFERDSAVQIVEALEGRIQHYIQCGTISVHGRCLVVPADETMPRRPISDYGRKKLAVEQYLLERARRDGFPATVLHPGHIVGPGWSPVNPVGHTDPRVLGQLARGEQVVLPHFGMETIHHVHADDVAQGFVRALDRRSNTLGEAFYIAAPNAVTLRGYAEAVAEWFGQQPNLNYRPWAPWAASLSKEHAASALDHIGRSPHFSIAKARRLLGYEPRYTSLEALYESVMWLADNGVIEVSGQF